MNTHPPRLLLTPREAAVALAISERTLFELRDQLRPLRIPGRGKARSLRYAVADLEAWIVQQQTAAATTAKPN